MRGLRRGFGPLRRRTSRALQQSPAFGRGEVELEDLSPGGLGTFVDAYDMETALAGGFAETRQAAEDFDEHRNVPMRGCHALLQYPRVEHLQAKAMQLAQLAMHRLEPSHASDFLFQPRGR